MAEGMKRFNLVLPIELHARLDQVAYEKRISNTALIIQCIVGWLDATGHGKEEK